MIGRRGGGRGFDRVYDRGYGGVCGEEKGVVSE